MRKYSGIAKKGKGRATRLGYPTANLPLPDNVPPGIYAAEATFRGRKYASVAFADTRRRILETHLLNFSGDLRGEILAIELIKKIRHSRRFEGDADIRAAIADDVEKARRIIERK